MSFCDALSGLRVRLVHVTFDFSALIVQGLRNKKITPPRGYCQNRPENPVLQGRRRGWLVGNLSKIGTTGKARNFADPSMATDHARGGWGWLFPCGCLRALADPTLGVAQCPGAGV